MTLSLLVATILSWGVAVGYVCQRKVLLNVAGDIRLLHSRTVYYGVYAGVCTIAPALGVLFVLHLLRHVINNDQITFVAVSTTAAGSALIVYWQTGPALRARNLVESMMLGSLLLSASIAVLTTLAIVLSLLGNTITFFTLYPVDDFLFGTSWSPSFSGRGGSSQLGLLPLLWGTLYITLIALVVAVPIGLFSAVYLAEYASPRIRNFAKPLLEVLVGIPTIVYGLVALLIVGPMLVQVFGSDGFGWMQDGTAVLTAGLVMGVMLIPFVLSPTEDAIRRVSKSMRDASLGLGATQSETIKQVVLPTALPGISGGIILAASRAIGETMIVVLGAGSAARLSISPFEAMTTVTAKIVSQLTGDSDFTSPEALVAYALASSLFVITLSLNMVGQRITRRYQEENQ